MRRDIALGEMLCCGRRRSVQLHGAVRADFPDLLVPRMLPAAITSWLKCMNGFSRRAETPIWSFAMIIIRRFEREQHIPDISHSRMPVINSQLPVRWTTC